MKGLCYGLIGLFLACTPRANAQAPATPNAAPGTTVTFEDVIREVVVKPSGTVFLNLGGKFPNETLTLVIMADTRPRFPEAETWEGKKVRVSGTVTEHQGHRRIILRERGQITLTGEPAKPGRD